MCVCVCVCVCVRVYNLPPTRNINRLNQLCSSPKPWSRVDDFPHFRKLIKRYSCVRTPPDKLSSTTCHVSLSLSYLQYWVWTHRKTETKQSVIYIMCLLQCVPPVSHDMIHTTATLPCMKSNVISSLRGNPACSWHLPDFVQECAWM